MFSRSVKKNLRKLIKVFSGQVEYSFDNVDENFLLKIRKTFAQSPKKFENYNFFGLSEKVFRTFSFSLAKMFIWTRRMQTALSKMSQSPIVLGVVR